MTPLRNKYQLKTEAKKKKNALKMYFKITKMDWSVSQFLSHERAFSLRFSYFRG